MSTTGYEARAEYFEAQTQKHFGMSAQEFCEHAEAGTLPDTAKAEKLLILSDLVKDDARRAAAGIPPGRSIETYWPNHNQFYGVWVDDYVGPRFCPKEGEEKRESSSWWRRLLRRLGMDAAP